MKKMYKKIAILLTFVQLIMFVLPVHGKIMLPQIEVNGASLNLQSNSDTYEIRFKIKVNTPIHDEFNILDQGALVIPFSINGEKDFYLDTDNVIKLPKNGFEYYSYEKDYYEFTSILSKIPVYNLMSDICVKGYITYADAKKQINTVYSDIKIYDVFSMAQKIMNSKNESENNKLIANKNILEKFDAYMNMNETAEPDMLSIVSPALGEIVYPYEDQAKNYILAGEQLQGDVNIETGNYVRVYEYRTNYVYGVYKPAEIKWINKYSNVDTFTITYSTNSDFSDAKIVYAPGNSDCVKLYNLYKASEYYVKLTANINDGTTHSVYTNFKTTDLGPRVIHLDGATNIRDLGGYMTSSGNRTLQGLIYRGGQMDGTFSGNSTQITAYGKHTAQNELGILVDLDFRGSDYPAPIPGSTHLYVGVGGYDLISAENKEKIREIFSVFSNINNYPLVFHCQGGADRTGTIAYLLNALLGVSELDIIRDYEFTSFSIYNNRHIADQLYIANPNYRFFETIKSQNGDTLQQKVENYLLSIGVTSQEISNIKSIMFNNNAQREVKLPTEFSINEQTELNIKINGAISDIESVYIGNKKVKWERIPGGLSVNASEFVSNITNGYADVKINYNDGDVYEGGFICAKNVEIFTDYAQPCTLEANRTQITSNPVGYGKWVKICMDANSNANGNIVVFLGSYGVRFRGNTTRYLTLDESGNIGLDARPANHNISQMDFAAGNNVYLYIKSEIVDEDSFKISVKTVNRDTGDVVAEQSYIGQRLETGEIANAPVTIIIDGSDTSKLIIY